MSSRQGGIESDLRNRHDLLLSPRFVKKTFNRSPVASHIRPVMDAHAQDQQFMSTFFPGASEPNHHRDSTHQNQHHHEQQQQQQQQQQQAMFNGTALTQSNSMLTHSMHGSNGGTPMEMDLIGSFMAMQGIESQPALSPNTQGSYNPQALLEQQFKLTQLQQLQQLQQQIFQQQIALISGGTSGANGSDTPQDLRNSRPQPFSGLPTPGNSTELRPQANNEYVSPMILQYMDAPQEAYQNSITQSPRITPNMSNNTQYMRQPGASSAPASIAFQHNSVPLSGDDFDVSPLTSPWLGAHQQSIQPRPPNKRTASPSDNEDASQPARKRMSPAVRPINPNSKKGPRISKSTSSTPLMRSARSRRDSIIAENDTPSPVDLSMPPPAPPSMLTQGSSSSLAQYDGSMTSPAQISPATPATMMNLGRLALSSGLTSAAPESSTGKKNDKGKSTAKPKPAENAGTRKAPKRGILPSTSPSLKSILPAGDASALHLGPSASPTELPIRKTSHKAAEQKRRDMLKTTFDDLRHLLPPVPLPSDENFPDEPILPGALPPRGPPKAGADGPNKGISKLQLLRCGNDFIRQLKGRVERRDEEIANLRNEVRRLREISGMSAFTEDGQGLDLERDLDAIEATMSNGFRRELTGGDEDDDDGF
ncbi:hypothetical protein HWV62_21754 [Athelia sp. TMB]|nr:hypothetical protein HWV62_21754 [Athelia sp. TMB]